MKSLYSLEVKLKVGQQRAKNYQDANIKGKAQNFNQKVETIKEKQTISGSSLQEEKELERLNKVVAKQQKMSDFSKFKQEEAQYNI